MKNPKKQPDLATPPVHCAHDRLAAVAELRPHPRNPQQHPEAQVALLAKIIAHQGWRAPIVVSRRSGFIVAGHGRLAAARKLGLELVPVNDQEFASDADELAHLAADNRIGELAETDGALLKDLLLELDTGAFDMDLSGFDAGELERVINSFKQPDGAQTGINYVPQFGVIVICKAEAEQEATYNALLALGYECKVVVT